MLNDKLTQDLLDKLVYALNGTNAIPAYVFNEIEPVIEKYASPAPEDLEDELE